MVIKMWSPVTQIESPHWQSHFLYCTKVDPPSPWQKKPGPLYITELHYNFETGEWLYCLDRNYYSSPADFYISSTLGPRYFIDGTEVFPYVDDAYGFTWKLADDSLFLCVPVGNNSYKKIIIEKENYIWGSPEWSYGSGAYGYLYYTIIGTYTRSGYPDKIVTRVIDGWYSTTLLGEYTAVGAESGTRFVGWRKLELTGNAMVLAITETKRKINNKFKFLGISNEEIKWDTGLSAWVLTIDASGSYWKCNTVTGTFVRVFIGTPPDPYPDNFESIIDEYLENVDVGEIITGVATIDANFGFVDTSYLERKRVYW